jgi:hypothetical protein
MRLAPTRTNAPARAMNDRASLTGFSRTAAPPRSPAVFFGAVSEIGGRAEAAKLSAKFALAAVDASILGADRTGAGRGPPTRAAGVRGAVAARPEEARALEARAGAAGRARPVGVRGVRAAAALSPDVDGVSAAADLGVVDRAVVRPVARSAPRVADASDARFAAGAFFAERPAVVGSITADDALPAAAVRGRRGARAGRPSPGTRVGRSARGSRSLSSDGRLGVSDVLEFGFS